jgi:hypothetical protein
MSDIIREIGMGCWQVCRRSSRQRTTERCKQKTGIVDRGSVWYYLVSFSFVQMLLGFLSVHPPRGVSLLKQNLFWCQPWTTTCPTGSTTSPRKYTLEFIYKFIWSDRPQSSNKTSYSYNYRKLGSLNSKYSTYLSLLNTLQEKIDKYTIFSYYYLST